MERHPRCNAQPTAHRAIQHSPSGLCCSIDFYSPRWRSRVAANVPNTLPGRRRCAEKSDAIDLRGCWHGAHAFLCAPQRSMARNSAPSVSPLSFNQTSYAATGHKRLSAATLTTRSRLLRSDLLLGKNSSNPCPWRNCGCARYATGSAHRCKMPARSRAGSTPGHEQHATSIPVTDPRALRPIERCRLPTR